VRNRRYICTANIHEGMILDQSVLDEYGHEMIKRGVRLDDIQVDYIQKKGIPGIYIVEEITADRLSNATMSFTAKQNEKREKRHDPPKATIPIREKVYIEGGMADIFSKPDSEIIMEKAGNITDTLLKGIKSNNATAADVRQLRIGDNCTLSHSVEVAMISVMIGKRYGLRGRRLRELLMAGLLHDIGKSQIPDAILNKPGRLTDEEFAIMKTHSALGYRLLKDKGFSNEILLGVLQHHEKLSGKGYPLGNSDNEISLFARIIAVADIYDALVAKRSYKQPFEQREAMEMLMGMGDDLDINVLRCFEECVILYPVGTMVMLSNGKTAKVVANNPDYPMRPKVVETESGAVIDLANDSRYMNIVLAS